MVIIGKTNDASKEIDQEKFREIFGIGLVEKEKVKENTFLNIRLGEKFVRCVKIMIFYAWIYSNITTTILRR